MRKILAAAVSLASVGAAFPAAAAWDAWPCEVVLCMANPAGPTAASACRPPIERLWREMARPRFRMPTCQQQSYPDNAQMVRDVQNVIANNPNPTAAQIQAGMTQTPLASDLPPGVAGVQMSANPYDPCEGGRTQVTVNRGGENVSECQGPQIGWIRDLYSDTGFTPVYEGYRQMAYPGMAFDIFINGQFWQRIRPDFGITFVGAATGGTWTPEFAPPPDAPTGLLPVWEDPLTLPDNTTLSRNETGRRGGGS